MTKKMLIVFKKQVEEKENAYSLVDLDTANRIPQNIIHSKKEVEDRLYSQEELAVMRDELV